ncbi:MAG TPA: 2,3-bisphosphoglycerate-independent phosphoglycerate mutase [Candidatus Woesebacteria bacterium]|nr:2,3-bisphosphoglycerate-independent phosphoglycerate mutase [Candidatus Woesebacteria bacterium]
MTAKHKVMTIILDGWGINKSYPGNAIALAKKPFFDELWQKYAHAQVECSGLAVGLPEGQMGTSEVNHMTIGAGRVIFQDLVRINQAIKDGSFNQNPELLAAIEHVKKHQSKLHIKGLFSPGGVHSHSDHFVAMARLAKAQGLASQTYYHLISDGRDTKPQSGLEYISEFEKLITSEKLGQVASLAGRYWAMDRDHNWDRTDKYFEAVTQGKSNGQFSSASEAIQHSYEQKITDEFIEPVLIQDSNHQDVLIEENDAVIFLNFRNDRPRQIVERFIEKGPANLYYVTITQYSPHYPVKVAFSPISTDHTLGEIIADAGLKQLRITETEKFAHLTFFMNCKREEPFTNEDRVMFDSYSDIKQHDEKPQMRTPDIANKLVEVLPTQTYQAIFVNMCNADMVGHTGNIEATIKGIEAIDQALSKVTPVALANGYSVIITADHGNAEQMLDEVQGDKLTAHTTYPVPLILVSSDNYSFEKETAQMADIAPTILNLLGISQPKEMTGISLVK